jgi:hypothetical protein
MKMICPKNWHELQHYSNRNAPWIKLHKSLLEDQRFNSLTDASKILAIKLWLIGTEYPGGNIPADITKISFRLRMSEDDLRVSLQSLLAANLFFETNHTEPVLNASNVLAGSGDILTSSFSSSSTSYLLTSTKEQEVRREDSVGGLNSLIHDKKLIKKQIAQQENQVYKSEFAIWYRAYPRRQSRGTAEKAYCSVRKSGVSAEELLDGAKRYAQIRSSEDRKYTKLPATWLNAECWRDELESGSSTRPSPVTPEQIVRMRQICLRDWSADKPWPAKNISGNGIWRDEYGIGPPPNHPETLVTAEELDSIPAAKEKFNKLQFGGIGGAQAG